MRAHLIWDWNGTLLRDDNAVLDATNEALAKLHIPGAVVDGVVPPEILPGMPLLTVERYQALFTRPLAKFYSAVFGRNVDRSEFLRLETLFREAYLWRLEATELNEGSLPALTSWSTAGYSQSLLSLWGHEELRRRTTALGITDYFVRIDGRSRPVTENTDGKAEPLRDHLEALSREGDEPVRVAVAAGRVAMIGDALDDAAAATAAGIPCVLFAGGSHSPAQLEATGAPVAATLSEAVALARKAIEDARSL